MSDNLENVVSMFYKIKLFFVNILPNLIIKAPLLSILAQAILDLIAKLETSIIAANQKLKGFAIGKQQKRSTMRDKTLIISSGLVAYYLYTDNPEEAEKARITKSGIDGLRDSEALFDCKNVLDIATPIIGDLSEAGLSAQMLASARTASVNYEACVGAPAHEIQVAAAFNKAIFKQVPKIMDKLYIFDNVMGTLREDFDTECDIWEGDRSINDNSGPGTTPDVDRPIPPLTIDPVMNLPYNAGRQWKITNEDPDNSIFYCLSSLNNTFTHSSWVLGPGKTVKVLSMALGPDGDFLLIQNITTLPMDVKVWAIE